MPPLIHYFKGSPKTNSVCETVRQMFYVVLITPMAAA